VSTKYVWCLKALYFHNQDTQLNKTKMRMTNHS